MSSSARASVPRYETVHSFWTASLLAGLLFVPGALGFIFEGLSFATGTALVLLGAVLLIAMGQIPFRARDVQLALGVAIAASFVILTHLMIAYAIEHDPRFDIGRALVSLFLMAFVLFSVPAVCDGILVFGSKLLPTAKIICGLFILIALFSILKIQPPTASLGLKPTFPYTEPSFLGFSMPGVLIFALLRSSTFVRVATIIVFLALGYALSNFTIIAACGLAAAVTLPLSWFIGGLSVLIMSLASLNLTYYTDRLNFDWATSNNLSSLVYVQGWQMLQEALQNTYGWGVGFQQLGVVYTNVPASYRINVLIGYDVNLQDGGFVLSKLGGEFGFFGIILAIGYLYVAGRSFLKLRIGSKNTDKMDVGELFARACIIGYAVELIVRGSNYFTGTFVLLLASLLYLFRMRSNSTQVLAPAA